MANEGVPVIFLEKGAQEEVKSKVKVRSSAQSLSLFDEFVLIAVIRRANVIQ